MLSVQKPVWALLNDMEMQGGLYRSDQLEGFSLAWVASCSW